MNHLLAAAAAVLALSMVACAGSTEEPTQQDGRHEYTRRVPAADAQKLADDITAKGVELDGQICYPRRYCSISAPDADGFSTVLAGMCCPDQACYSGGSGL